MSEKGLQTIKGVEMMLAQKGYELLEPTSIEKMPKGYSLSIDPGIGEDKTIVQVYDTKTSTFERDWKLNQFLSVSPLMRRLGYTRNPHDCLYFRKRMYLGMTRFQCSDCGELL